MSQEILSGLRVLVVDDDLIIGLLVQDTLVKCGCTVAGPFDNMPDALRSAETESLDAAVLDINIAGEEVFPVAEILERRQVPFLFISGYGQAAIPADRPHWLACTKPFRAADLVAMLAAQIRNKTD
jgi:DNA-binding response OmpR family regulator